MKRRVLLSGLATLLMAFSATAARAAPFTLTLIDCGADLSCAGTGDNTSFTFTDNFAPDSLLAVGDKMAFGTQVVGNFSVTTGIATTLFNGAQSTAGPVEMTLPLTFKVSTTKAGLFEAILYHSDLSSPLLGPNVKAAVVSNTNSPSSVAFTSWLDLGNQAYQSTPPPGAVQVVSLGNATPVVVDVPYTLAPNQKFSLYSKLDFVFGTAGSVTAGTDFQVINGAPISTPEPSTMMLFGSGVGLLGLGSFGRRRSKKGKYQQFREKGVLMKKKIVLLPVLVAVLLSFNASPARAGFILTVSDVNAGITHTVHDNDALVDDPASSDPADMIGDYNTATDAIRSFGSIGNFNFQFSEGSISTLGQPTCFFSQVCMDLASYLITNEGQTSGKFKATLLRTDLSRSALGVGPAVQGISTTTFLPDYTVTGFPVATAVFTSFIDPTNSSNPSSVVIPIDSSTVVPMGGNLFSMYSTLEITFSQGKGASASGDSMLEVRNTVVPEPSTMMLFGSGLGMFGLASFRRSKKA